MRRIEYAIIVIVVSVLSIYLGTTVAQAQRPVRERPQAPISVPVWIEIGGISLRTDAIVGFEAHENREETCIILTNGGWEFEVPVTYSRIKERLSQ